MVWGGGGVGGVDKQVVGAGVRGMGLGGGGASGSKGGDK